MDAARSQRLATLISELDERYNGVGDEARYTLIDDFGAEALEPLMAAAPSLGDFGKLGATHVFRAIGDPRATSVMIPWLQSDSWVVRAWSAEALADVGATEAIGPLRDAWEAAKRAGPPDQGDAVALRDALHQLGARSVVLPAEVAALRVPESEARGCRRDWPVSALPAVLDGLAAAAQVVLWFQLWRPRNETFYHVETILIELDWSRQWQDLVADSLADGLTALLPDVPPDTVLSVEWVDRTDVDSVGDVAPPN